MPRRYALVLLAVAACRGGDQEAPPPPVTTTTPLTVTGPDSLIGLIRLGPLADGSGLLPAPLQLRAAPSDSADTVVTVTRWQDVLAEEVGYEEPALVAWRSAPPWYLIATRDSIRGWIRPGGGAQMVPLAELLVDRLAYLTPAWNGRLHRVPGQGEAVHVNGAARDDGEASVAVLGSRLVDGALWVQVAVHDRSPCESATDPTVVAEGWVPAWTGGRPTVWYYSRGC